MPIIKSSIKDVRRTKTRHDRNKLVISRLRTALSKVRKSTTQAEAKKTYAEAQKLLDKAASKGYIHKNRAARTKARLMLGIAKIKTAA